MKLTEKQIFNAYLAVITLVLFTYAFIVLSIINNLKPIF